MSSIFAKITLEYVRGCFCPEDSTLHLFVAPYCPFCSWNHPGSQTLSLLGFANYGVHGNLPYSSSSLEVSLKAVFHGSSCGQGPVTQSWWSWCYFASGPISFPVSNDDPSSCFSVDSLLAMTLTCHVIAPGMPSWLGPNLSSDPRL